MSTRSMSHYLIIMFMIMIMIFRFIVLSTTVLGINFPIVSTNEMMEIGIILTSLVCIILFSRTKLIGGIIYLTISCIYYGPEIISSLPTAISGVISVDEATKIIVAMIEIVVAIFALFILIYDKKQEINPVDKKTDFFYKGDQYDRKYDDRADKNNYRTM